jgi:phosphatidate cytidylyltransferase
VYAFQEMKRIITAAILIPLVLVLVFKAPFWLMPILAAVVALPAAWEFLGLANASGARTPKLLVLASIAVLLYFSFRQSYQVPPVLSGLSLLILVYCAFRGPLDTILKDVGSSVFCLVYIGLSMATIPWLAAQENGPSLLTYLLCVVWSGDTLALYIGRAYGRHKLAPELSPNKTWEGSVASMVGSILITLLLTFLATVLARRGSTLLSYPGSVYRWIFLAVLLNVAAQVGDLVESAIKRGAGVKDSGTLLPGHGGMLDRIDALLLAAPVLWYAQLVQQPF